MTREIATAAGYARADWPETPTTLYPRNSTPRLGDDLYRSPTSEYRGALLWSWNTFLQRDEPLCQIDYRKEAAFGGFHVHETLPDKAN
jgi:hypothetical protein